MKKTQPRKLRLEKTTLRHLDAPSLEEVAGGGITWICTVNLTTIMGPVGGDDPPMA